MVKFSAKLVIYFLSGYINGQKYDDDHAGTEKCSFTFTKFHMLITEPMFEIGADKDSFTQYYRHL